MLLLYTMRMKKSVTLHSPFNQFDLSNIASMEWMMMINIRTPQKYETKILNVNESNCDSLLNHYITEKTKHLFLFVKSDTFIIWYMQKVKATLKQLLWWLSHIRPFTLMSSINNIDVHHHGQYNTNLYEIYNGNM